MKMESGIIREKIEPCKKLINWAYVIKETGIDRNKVYNNAKGVYNSLTDKEVNLIIDKVYAPIKEFFTKFGIAIYTEAEAKAKFEKECKEGQ